jgi:hypothetical protein
MGVVQAEFSAPWSRSLRILSTVAVIILVGLTVASLLITARLPLPARIALGTAAPVVLLLALLSMVRGYVLTDSQIEVRRLGWSTILPLAGLAAVSGEPDGMRGSLRLFGNGGLFAISGWFWNRKIGRYRAYATDPERAVLLRYRDGAKVVLTPHDVQHFIVRLRRLAAIT